MIGVLFYIGVGLYFYSLKNNNFDYDKPRFWGIVLGWPLIHIIYFLGVYAETIKEFKDRL